MNRIRLGPWSIEIDRIPCVPLHAATAVHDDYDGPKDHRHAVDFPALDRHGWVGRARALRDVLDEILTLEADAEADVPSVNIDGQGDL